MFEINTQNGQYVLSCSVPQEEYDEIPDSTSRIEALEKALLAMMGGTQNV